MNLFDMAIFNYHPTPMNPGRDNRNRESNARDRMEALVNAAQPILADESPVLTRDLMERFYREMNLISSRPTGRPNHNLDLIYKAPK